MEVIMDWISTHIMEILTCALVIITGIYAVLTWRYVRLTNRLLKTTTDTPHIAIYLSFDDSRVTDIMLCVENIGTGPAHDVKFPGDLSFPTRPSMSLEDVGFLKGGINYLRPGGKRECYLSSLIKLVELKETPLKISVTYKDSEKKKEYSHCFSLDFGEYMNTPVKRSPLHNISETLQRWKP